MKKYFHICLSLFLISFKGYGQYDSLSMNKFIEKFITNGTNSEIFVRVSDSLNPSSYNLEGKKFILQVNHKAKLVNNKFIEALSMNSLGLWYMDVGLTSDSYNCLNEALSIFKSINNQSGVSNATSNLGILFSKMGQLKKALVFNIKALSIIKNTDNIQYRFAKCANICLNIGAMYGMMDNLVLAREYFQKALSYYVQDPQKDSITRAYIFNNIADTYLYDGDIKNAQKYSDIAFNIKLKYGSSFDKTDAYLNRGAISENKGSFNEAKNMYLKALSYTDTLIPTLSLKSCYLGLAGIYYKLKDFKNENRFLKLRYKTENYLDSIGKASEISNIELKTAFRQQAVNDSIQNTVQLKIRDVKIDQKKRESVYGIIALVVMSILAFLFFNRFRITQKQKSLIETQKKIVDEKNREITDSINYAKNLQDALIPNPDELPAFFNDAFVLFFPKDIVAGDFYWWHRFSDSNKTLVAVADCTGHGVPGSLVSVVCINALNRAVNEFSLVEPNEILNKVNLLVNETFGKNNKQVNDGMDISLILIDTFKNEVRWAGANNKLIYFKNDDMIVVNPDKQPIGKNENYLPFSITVLPLVKDSVFYLITDGFSDQFGGDKNKKMGFAKFKQLLEASYKKPMREQKEIFEKEFLDWKDKREQTDDVSLIGIKL
jgi:serine phosphatase RsbU (regulator of sigma subunit)